MIELQQRHIQLKSQPANKQAAIQQAGQLLVANGQIELGYIQSMLQREALSNTYLGNGIAIPHGLPEARDLIRQTGIVVLQVPNGVQWNPGETVHLIVGIAARSDEHIAILRQLTRVLGDKTLVDQLTHTTNPDDLIRALTGAETAPAAPAAPAISVEVASDQPFFETKVLNPTGFHARPATTFVDCAKRFQAEVRMRYGSREANGKSLISILQLGIPHGATIQVTAQGSDAAAALRGLQQALAQGLADETAETLPTRAAVDVRWTPTAVEQTINGISAAPGLAIGLLRRYSHSELVIEDRPSDPMVEVNRFELALAAAQAELATLYDEVQARIGSGKAAIFRVHSEMLSDTSLVQQTVSLLFEKHSAEWAWHQVISGRVAQIEKLDDQVLAGRAVDLSDVGQRVLRQLIGGDHQRPLNAATPVIILADDLTPSDTAAFDPDTILGFGTVRGGPTSHTAILARSLGIPAIVGAGEGLLNLADEAIAILDGYNGKLYVNPSSADIEAATNLQAELAEQHERAQATRFEPAQTSDGHRIEIAANINRVADASVAAAAGAEGVGLMRTEFLFLERDSAPSEEEQFEAYRDMVQAMAGHSVIIRTLDIGGDKVVPYLDLPKEDNSFLGIRGIRLCLARPELFIPQLRAIYRAAAFGPLKIMFPMIATLEDWYAARDLAEQVRRELDAPQVPLGIMVEVPSAAVLAEQFAQEVDFFSVGTNDLTQYTLAMDRLHPQLASQADGLHPAVLRMIDLTARAANAHNKWVGVCGGIAADARGSLILVGLGVHELSVSVPAIAELKAAIRQHSLADLQALAQRALACRSAAEVHQL